jgi:hypothetical protein
LADPVEHPWASAAALKIDGLQELNLGQHNVVG